MYVSGEFNSHLHLLHYTLSAIRFNCPPLSHSFLTSDSFLEPTLCLIKWSIPLSFTYLSLSLSVSSAAWQELLLQYILMEVLWRASLGWFRLNWRPLLRKVLKEYLVDINVARHPPNKNSFLSSENSGN